MPRITALLFDCDNTLVLSEERAFEACAELANEILESHGIPDRYTGAELLKEFVGQNFRGMMTNLKAKYTYEMDPQELEEYVKKEEDKVISKFEEYLAPCEGVEPVLAKLKEENKYFFAVVSSSALRRVKASIIKVGQDKYFDLDHIYSAASSLDKPTSKPDPAIYIHALRVIGKDASDCVAIEDSKSGVGSATNAKIKTIGYVGPYEPEKRAEMGQKLKEAGACIIMNDWSEFPKCIEAIEAGKA